ncbi:DEAD/DEAH box helicase [Haloechinothrix sp. LS1_15]|uniref:DEAD/DEAH box helicase n=1 Tax=Haloechinothrix sp. LS1_15 TaxID=2652248 RepID=UPI0029475DA4|nr:DEAD/DEAH box helicase [Haloechinothrix sp. LS1_15]MDV6013873.1 DEAD/DEAH box helicase [Haloechinothrix sp. LS1_15]
MNNTPDPHTPEHSTSGAAEPDPAPSLEASTESTEDAVEAPTFAELGVSPELVKALSETGIERTFAIQQLALPLALRGEDVIGQARTGMGKTLAYGVPVLEQLELPGDGTPRALVVVPTRELCLQVTHDLTEAGKYHDVRTLAIYGGRPYEPQIEALREGVDIVVGTPGRLLDLAEQRHLVLGKLSCLVLDEADEMLDLGFLPDIERILTMVPEKRQTMLFSATMPDPIITLARTFLDKPTHIHAEQGETAAVHERTKQFVYRAHALDKPELVARVLQAEGRGLTMLFTRTKRTAQKVADDLSERGFAAAAVHGDLGQGAREQALRAFRSGKVDVLVATDVAARGIDVDDVTHVINYQTPDDDKTYVHRIGRTGRAGKTGVAITLVDWDEETRWKLISDTLGLGIPQAQETYSTSPHLYAELGIPSDATGRLPLSARHRAGLGAEYSDDDGRSPGAGKRADGGRGRRRGRGGGRSAGSATTEQRDQATGSADDGSSRRRRRTRSGSRNGGGAASAQSTSRDRAEGHSSAAGSRRRRRRTRSGQDNAAPSTRSTGSTTE